MARKKNLFVLLAVLVVLIAATVLVFNMNDRKEEIKNYGEAIISFNEEDVTALLWSYDESFSLKKENGEWKLEGNDSFPVNETMIESLLDCINGLSAKFIINGTENYADYGLRNPQCSVKISCGEEDYQVDFGGYSSMDNLRYVSIGDGNAYLISEDVMEYFDLDEGDIIKLDGAHSAAILHEFRISGENNIDIVYEEDPRYCYSHLYKYYLKNGDEYLPLDEDNASTLVSVLTDGDFRDYVTYTASKEDLSKYGLDDPLITARASYEDADGEDGMVTANIGKNSKDEYFLMFEGSEIVYSITETKYGVFKDASFDSLRPEEVLRLDWNNVESADFLMDGTNYEIAIQHKNDDSMICKYEGEEADLTSVMSSVDALELEDKEADGTESKKMLQMSFKLKNEGAETVTVAFYKYTADACLVELDGELTGTVERSDIIELMEEINKVVLGTEKTE